MKRYQALLQERADLVNEAKGIFAAAETEGRDLTDVEKGRDDAINARLNALAGDIAREERRRENERTVAATPVTGGRIESVRDLAAERPFESFGEQLAAVYQAARAPHNVDSRLLALTGAGESGTSGEGFLVQQEFTNETLTRMYNTGEIARRVNRRQIGPGANGVTVNVLKETSRATGSRWGGARMYWLNEGGTIGSSKPAYRRFGLSLEKLAGIYVATDELLADAVGLQSEVTSIFPKEITFAVEDAIVNGDGAGKPLGLMNAPAKIAVAKEGGQVAATIVHANIVKMWSRMWAGSRSNAVWLYNQDIEPQLHSMALPVGTAGIEPRFVNFTPDGGVTAFGRPMIPVEYCQTLGTEGDLILTDLNEYRWIDKGGVRQDTSMHVYFSTDEMAFRFIYRCNGAPFWESALTPAKGSNTLSPIVTLATRA